MREVWKPLSCLTIYTTPEARGKLKQQILSLQYSFSTLC